VLGSRRPPRRLRPPNPPVDRGFARNRSADLSDSTLNRAWKHYTAQVEDLDARDRRREIAEKNLSVLRQRRERYDDLLRTLQTARGQMDLLENSFRLLADEIVSMANPAELGQRLDDLRIAVDAIRETVQESDIQEEGGESARLPRVVRGSDDETNRE
jgi:hypothetical protein